VPIILIAIKNAVQTARNLPISFNYWWSQWK